MGCIEENVQVDGYYCPEVKSRWKSYNHYKLMLWIWMMSEITTVFSPAEISHNGLYVHALIQAIAVIFIGMPLAYSEICLGQYTNCDIFSVWDFCPLFRNVGYATYYLIFFKVIYYLVLSSWYLLYTFYAAMTPPPWMSCEDFSNCKCMVKRINISVFQHCLEAQFLFEDDCGMKTASNCFFEREIGNNCTKNNLNCFFSWKTIIAMTVICFSVYVFSLKKEKIIQIFVKTFAIYLTIMILVLFTVALSNSGTWYATKITFNWSNFNFFTAFSTVSNGFLSIGTGSGILLYLSRDVSFRSPATMTAISTCLLSLFVTLMFSLIAYSGIKTMSYYHGEEENVLEFGRSLFFPMFASMSEIISYFDPVPVWGIVWFSMGFFSLYINFWLLCLYLQESLNNNFSFAKKYPNLSRLLLMKFIMICSMPFLCSDITTILTDAITIMQTFNSLLFSLSLYWIYGIKKHNIDTIFMIGIKANYFWKITWILNPIIITVILYKACDVLLNIDSQESYYIRSLKMAVDILMAYFILGIYSVIIVVGVLLQILNFYFKGKLRFILSPTRYWGPRDKILFKSRIMFLPEIMTREFLYRQVRIRLYRSKQQQINQDVKRDSTETTVSGSSWSALTSN